MSSSCLTFSVHADEEDFDVYSPYMDVVFDEDLHTSSDEEGMTCKWHSLVYCKYKIYCQLICIYINIFFVQILNKTI